MTVPALPTTFDPAELELASRTIAHWRGDDVSVNLLSGQLGTFTRAATATLVDTNGTSFTAAQSMPRFEPRDWEATSARTHMGLLMGTSDRLLFAADWRPRAFAFLLEFIEAGTIGTANAALCSVSNDAITGARFAVDVNVNLYRVRFHNGSAEVTATLAAAPTSGQRVVLRGQVYADGSVQMWQQINGAAETATARSAAPAGGLASAWGTGALLRLNAFGTGNAGSVWVKRLKLVPGLPDAALLARVF